MKNGIASIPLPVNEPIRSYGPGSPEKETLKAKIAELKKMDLRVPLIIGGKEIYTDDEVDMIMPHNHEQVLGRYCRASEAEVRLAVEEAQKAKREWESMPWESRASIILKAATLLAGPHRDALNGSTMLGQSKTVYQAEIDSACELIDFMRFNCYYMQQIYEEQPWSGPGIWNYVENRALDGFIFAVTPFNFSSIAGNLPSAPALMGNTVIWKPASTAVFSAYFMMKIFEEAGMPPGVINMVPGRGSKVGPMILENENLAGIHFTGSTDTFQNMWKTVGDNIMNYKCYPRIVGETGGKDFIFVHSSADIPALTAATVRGAFEYQGQKCSAASRMYVPESIWGEVRKQLIDAVEGIRMGDVEDFRNFMAAVIDRSSFQKIKGYIEDAGNSGDAEILTGGKCDDSKGFFIEPTVILAHVPDYLTMREEIFGPVLTIYVYPDEKYEETLLLCDKTSPYALTGAVFAQNRKAVLTAMDALRGAAGNFYINDKPTGAVVGQQPFGGSRASGTNDKAGSHLNLLRWCSVRTIKENFNPPKDYKYPHMLEE